MNILLTIFTELVEVNSFNYLLRLVSGTCTSVAKRKNLDELGFDAYVFDSKDPK